MIKVKNLKKSYGDKVVLKDISTDIDDGSVVVLIGPSGLGKSTLLRCLNNLEEVDSGQIFYDDIELTSKTVDIDKMRQHIGMVFQHFNLFPHKTILENITLAPINLKLMNKEDAEKKGIKLLKRISISLSVIIVRRSKTKGSNSKSSCNGAKSNAF